MPTFRCAGTTTGTVNGIGLCYEIFFQGCDKNCDSCQNPELQSLDSGQLIEVDVVIDQLISHHNFYNSVVFLGGEPLLQQQALYSIAKNTNLPNILYTGWLFNDIPDHIKSIMSIIIDGPYIKTLKSNFPSSNNQKIYINNSKMTAEHLHIFKSSHPSQEINYYANRNNIQ